MSVERPNDPVARHTSGHATPNALIQLSHFVLAADLIGAAALWFFRESIFGVSDDTEMMAIIGCAALVVGGIVSFLVIQKIAIKRDLK